MTSSDSGRGYRFLPAVEQYSAGVCADEQHELRRVEVGAPLPITEGFRLAEQMLACLDAPPTALCAIELRSPAAMTQSEFELLNHAYRIDLAQLGLLIDQVNPIARTNVCPIDDPPHYLVIHAFSYVAPRVHAAGPSFVIAGSAEAPEGGGPYVENAIAHGDTSLAGLLAKATWVLDEMERRLSALGQTWPSCSDIDVYTRFHDDGALQAAVKQRTGPHARTCWWPTTPPVQGLEFEMDCRSVITQRGHSR